MKLVRTITLLAVLSVAMITLSLAQGGAAPAKPATPSSQASPQPSQPAPTISNIVDRQISLVEKEFVEAAEAMPDDKFNFSPETLKLQGADYNGVRTFALEVRHVATANYVFWAPLTGDQIPPGIKGPNGPEELKTKAEIIKFLKDSFALGHKAVVNLNAQNATETVQTFRGTQPRLYLATFPVAHAFDHYGQMVEYLRMNGITPPASRQQ